MPIRAKTTVGGGLVLAAVLGCSSLGLPPTATLMLATVPAAAASPAAAPAAAAASSPVIGYTERRLLATDDKLNPPSFPVRTKPDGSWLTVPASDWTAGFYAATLWRTYERTRDQAWLKRAQTWQAKLASETTHDNTDLGFKLFDTYGVGYQLTGNSAYKKVVLDAAATVAKRYDPDVRMFRVWDSRDDKSQYRVNIDATMNLELMFWAGQNGGKPEYAAMATQHALRAINDLVRPDGGTWMVAEYDQKTGALLRHSTKQGYATESTWSRGQAWAMYGFTMAYRYTKDPRFLDTARRTADYFVRRLPPDKVPYWDFDVPNKATAPRDTSAAAIAASALLELSTDETDAAAKKHDVDAARDILTSLSSPTYAPRSSSKFAAMLQHGTQHQPKGWADTGIMFGDYYFVEALGRYEKTVGSTAGFMSG
jgi:unsaturated chondroitin disaccharide hydrolase